MTKNSFPHLHALPSGTILNHMYQIEDVLGEGGFGITYRGIISKTGATVAIKEYFPPSLAVRSQQEGEFMLSPYPKKNDTMFQQEKERFLNEAAILKSFQNLACIVSVHDLFEENGTAYLVMEYIEGLSLRKFINENGTLTFPEISTLIIPVIQSLAEIHERGLIHRDISPDNLILGTDNKLHLIDFGAASHKDYTNSKNTVILKSGYAPPEQYDSNSRIGAWLDVYALCATIYFCITGSAPAESIHRPDSASSNSLSELSGLLAWQRAVLEKGLELRPADRFHNMYALMSALKGSPETDNDRTVIHSTTGIENRKRLKKSRHFPGKIFIPVLLGSLTFIILAAAWTIITRNHSSGEPPISAQTSSYPTENPTPAPTTEPPALPTADSGFVAMPDLKGMTVKSAKKRLKKLNPSIRVKTTVSYSKKIPNGKIIAQSIAEGTVFSPKNLSSISLSVSKGPRPPVAQTATPRPSKKTDKDTGYHVREEEGLSPIDLH